MEEKDQPEVQMEESTMVEENPTANTPETEEDPIIGYNIDDAASVTLSGKQFKLFNAALMMSQTLMQQYVQQRLINEMPAQQEMDEVVKNLKKIGKLKPIRQSDTIKKSEPVN